MMDKKKRSANFNNDEINHLMNCLMPEMGLIENKKTDGASLKEKNSAWQRVTNKFNSLNGNLLHRDVNCIKLKYDNIKRNLKKKVTANKANLKKTGGGPQETIPYLWYEEQLYSLLELGIEGLASQGDCDNVSDGTWQVQNVDHSYSNSDVVYGIFEDTTMSVEELVEPTGEPAEELYKKGSSESDSMLDVQQPSTSNRNKYMLQENIALEANILEPQSQIHQRTPQISSNRLNLKKQKKVSAQQKNANLDSFQKLAEGKMELVKIQRECMEIELKDKKQEIDKKSRDQDVRREISELELKIKKEEFEERKEMRERNKILFNLQLEKEKLQIEILKCELNAKLKENFKNLH